MNTAHNTPENAKVLLLNNFIFSNTGTSDKELLHNLTEAMGSISLEWEKQKVKEKILNFSEELLTISRHTAHIWESGRQTTQDEKEQIATSNAQKLNTLIDKTAEELIKYLITDKSIK